MITVIQDNQEKIPWDFTTYSEYIEHQIVKKIPTGDYTILNHETELVIERKRDIDELANNLGNYYARFRRQLLRMTKYKYSYVICEFPRQHVIDYPATSNVSKYHWVNKKPWVPKRTGISLLHQIDTIVEKYHIEFIFSMNRECARYEALNIMRRIDERI